MARQYMKVVGVGGGRAGRAPRPIIRAGRAPRVYRTTEQILAKAKQKNEQREI